MLPALQVVKESVGEPVQAQVQGLVPFGAFMDFDVEVEDGSAVTMRGLMHRRPPNTVACLVISLHDCSHCSACIHRLLSVCDFHRLLCMAFLTSMPLLPCAGTGWGLSTALTP